MSAWLCTEETPFAPSLFVTGAARAARTTQTCSVLLRTVRVLDNKRLFWAADVVVYAVTVDGYPDMKSQTPFWVQQFLFANVKDGATLPIDSQTGVLLYRGRPRDFLNLYLLVIRDTKTTQDFATLLKQNFVANGIGTLAGAAVSIYAGLPATATAPVVRDLTTQAVNTTLDYFSQQKNQVIGAYYASLLPEHTYGVGLHPPNYSAGLIDCGGALAIGYQVTVSEPAP